jgi:hypothetical protein
MYSSTRSRGDGVDPALYLIDVTGQRLGCRAAVRQRGQRDPKRRLAKV